MNTDKMRAVMIFGPIQHKLIVWLDKVRLVNIRKVMAYTHPLVKLERPIYVCSVEGFGPFISFINWLFMNGIVADDISKRNLNFLERDLERITNEGK